MYLHFCCAIHVQHKTSTFTKEHSQTCCSSVLSGFVCLNFSSAFFRRKKLQRSEEKTSKMPKSEWRRPENIAQIMNHLRAFFTNKFPISRRTNERTSLSRQRRTTFRCEQMENPFTRFNVAKIYRFRARHNRNWRNLCGHQSSRDTHRNDAKQRKVSTTNENDSEHVVWLRLSFRSIWNRRSFLFSRSHSFSTLLLICAFFCAQTKVENVEFEMFVCF